MNPHLLAFLTVMRLAAETAAFLMVAAAIVYWRRLVPAAIREAHDMRLWAQEMNR